MKKLRFAPCMMPQRMWPCRMGMACRAAFLSPFSSFSQGISPLRRAD